MRTRTQLLVLVLVLVALTQARGWWFDAQTRELLGQAEARAKANVELEELVGRIASEAVDLETGLRGYLTVHDRLYLEPYDRATRALDAQFGRAASLLDDDPQVRAALSEVRTRLADWQAHYADPVLAGASEEVAGPALGKRLMDGVRGAIEELRRALRERAAEDARLGHEELDAQSNRAVATQVALLAVFGLVLVAVSLQIERPLAQLAAVAGRRDLSEFTRISVRGAREAVLLGDALAQMGRDLGARQEADQRYAELLGCLARGQGSDALSREILTLLVRRTGASGGVLWAGDPGAPLVRVAVEGFDPAALPAEPPSAVLDARASARPVRLSGLAGDTRFAARTSLGTRAPGTILVVPLAMHEAGSDRVLGVLELVSDAADAFRDDLSREVASIALALARAASKEHIRTLNDRLAREQARLQSMFDVLPDGLLLLEPGGLITQANPAAERLLGQVAGRPVSEVAGSMTVTMPDGSPVPPQPPSVGALIGSRRRITTPDGDSRQLVINAVPVPAPGGGEPSYVISFRDETREYDLQQEVTHANDELRAQNEELRAQEEELRAQSEALARASGAKSDFLATMSHELRTPLNAVLGFSELLLAEPKPPEPEALRQTVGDIHAAGRQLLRLIDEVLDLSKLEAGKLEIALSPVAVEPVVRAALTLVAPAAQRKHLAMKVDVAPGLAARADADRLRQILANLLANAVKFTPDGGTVSVHAGLEDQRVRIAVSDTGIGIAPEDLARLFQPFTQVRTGYARPHGGTGLGLSISRRLAQAMGGDVEGVSAPGRGSTFSCVIPAAAALVDGPAPRPSPRGGRVLLVEDEEAPRRLVERVLVAAGFEVKSVSTGEEALVAVAERAPDLVILDLCLPGLSGVECLRRLRENAATRGLPVVVLTALDLDANERAYVESAAQLVAQKGAVTRADFVGQLIRLVDRPSGLDVLVVDDNASNRKVARAMLEALGHRVREADGAQAGLEAAREAAPALILMDIEMPGMDGLTATRTLRADPDLRAIPVIAMTAHAMPLDRARALEAGCDGFVAKPVARTQLADALAAAVRPRAPAA